MNAKISNRLFPGDDSLPSQNSGLEVKLEFLQKLAMSDTDRVAEVLDNGLPAMSELTINNGSNNSYLEQAALAAVSGRGGGSHGDARSAGKRWFV